MDISQNALDRILSGARKLCSPEGDKKINEYKVTGYDRNYFDGPDSVTTTDDYSEYFDYDDENEKNAFATSEPIISENKLRNKNSGIPAAIRESFANKQIDTTRLSNISVLDQMSPEAKNRIANSVKAERKPTAKQTMNEQVNHSQNMVGIDYTALKAIMKECIEEYFDKHPLNESTGLKTIGFSGGNINLVDNKGNVFGAKLKLLKKGEKEN